MPDQSLDQSFQSEENFDNEIESISPEDTSSNLLPGEDDFQEYFKAKQEEPPSSTTVFPFENNQQTSDESKNGLPEVQIDFGADLTEASDSIESSDASKNGLPEVQIDFGAELTEASDSIESTSRYESVSRQDLEENAANHFGQADQLETFLANLDEFEKRAEQTGIDSEERETFYGQVGAVLEASDSPNKHYTQNDLKDIASGMMLHAAKPGTVDQGAESTCSTAALETVLYGKEPATVGELVADIAIKGEYLTADGTPVTLSDRNFKLDKYKDRGSPESARDLSSHIAQLTMINAHWARQDGYMPGETGKLGKIRYEEGHPKDFIGDARSRMMDYSTDPPQPYTETVGSMDPTLPQQIIVTDNRPVNGPSMQMDYMSELYSQLRGNEGSLTIINGIEGPGIEVPKSVDDLKQMLGDAKNGENGSRFPILLGVHANREPFMSDLFSSAGEMSQEEKEILSKMHAHHAVAIIDYNPETGAVSIENQWGEGVDHTGAEGSKETIDAADLFAAITKPDTRHAPEDGGSEEKRAEKEPSPDAYINPQSKFVDELSRDDAVAPEKLWSERFKLYRYLDHFGRNSEADKLENTLMKGLQERLEDQGLDPQLLNNASSLLRFKAHRAEEAQGNIPDASEENNLDSMPPLPEGSRELLDAIDRKFMESTDGGKFELDQFKELLNLHTYAGDKEGSDKLARDFMESSMKGLTSEDIYNENKRDELRNVVSLLSQTEHNSLANEMAGEMLQLMRSSKQKGDGQVVTMEKFEAKTDMRHMFRYLDRETAATLGVELNQDYDRFIEKHGVDGDKAYEAATMRMNLIRMPEGGKGSDRLNQLVTQQLDWLSREPIRDGDGSPRGADHPSMTSSYEYFGDILKSSGNPEGAINLYERALELSEKHNQEDRLDWFVQNLVHCYDITGQSEKADALLEKTGIEVFRRRRNR